MTTWIVDDSNNGNGDFSTIAEAIANAAAGDKIIVTGGDDNIHNEANITVDKELTIKSDFDGVTIDAQGAGRVFLIDDNNDETQLKVKFKGLTITGGSAVGDGENQEDLLGGGILNKEQLTVKYSTITENTAQLRGGGIYNDGGQLIVEHSVISKNISEEASGGGISNTGNLEVNYSIIENNDASAGGGIANAGEAKITASSISGHTSYVGAGIFNLGGQLKVNYSNISNNHALIDGGGILSDSGSIEIKHSSIADNSADNQGGGVFTFNGNLIVDKSIIRDNSGIYGAGIVGQLSNVEIKYSAIIGNDGVFGGGITTAGSTLSLNNNILYKNTAIYGDSDILELVTFIPGTPDGDDLIGTSENDQIVGFEGNDTIDGQGGDDLLFGGIGADTFVLAAGGGSDIIADFTDGDGDKIQLNGSPADYTFALVGANTEITYNSVNSGSELVGIVVGVDITDSIATDVLFV
jgi:hypothetical protein